MHKNTIAGFVAGLSVGVLASILLAPAKGSDTRQSIIDKSSELCCSVMDFFTGLIKGKNKSEEKAPGSAGPSISTSTMG